MVTMKLSIIIVNYKTYDYTFSAIKSVLNSYIDFEYEIFLIDNASNDGSIEKLEQDFFDKISNNKIEIIKNTENLGFAKANNIAIKKSNSDYILLLNSDTKVSNTAIYGSVNYLESLHKPAILTCKVLLEDGKLDHSCKRGFPTPEASFYYFTKLDKKNPQKYGAYDYLTLDENEIGYVDAVSGAFMLIAKEIIENVGLLDEDYFMYAEDIDYCYRAKQAGYEVIYYPKETITHYKNKSRPKRKYKTIYNFYHTMWLFYKKHYIKKYNPLVTLSVICGISLKYLIELIKNAVRR